MMVAAFGLGSKQDWVHVNNLVQAQINAAENLTVGVQSAVRASTIKQKGEFTNIFKERKIEVLCQKSTCGVMEVEKCKLKKTKRSWSVCVDNYKGRLDRSSPVLI